MVPLMRVSAADKAILYRELAKLIGSGFHLDRSVTMLIGQNPPAGRKAVLEGIERGLAAGLGFAKSLALSGEASGLETALADAGERSGTLAQSLDHLAQYFSAIDEGVRQARGALIYPLILVHLGIVLPEIPSAVSGQGGFLPAVLVNLAVLWLILLGLVWGWRTLSAAAVRSASADAFLDRAPFLGKVRRHWALARFCQVSHAGLLAAMRISEITKIAGEASQSARLKSGAESAAARIELGDPLAASLSGSGAFAKIFTDSIATAEESGTLDREMERWAAAETASAGDAVKKAAVWLPMIAYGLITLYVAYRIIAMVIGIYSPVIELLKQ